MKTRIEFDMPDSCDDCPEVDCVMGYKYFCRRGAGHLGDIDIKDEYKKERHPSCPLICEKALTIDELRKMVGKPVWIPEMNSYAIVKCYSIGRWANIVFVRGTDYSYGTGVDFEYDVDRRGLRCYRCV